MVHVLLLKERMIICYKHIKNAGQIIAKPIDFYQNLPRKYPQNRPYFFIIFCFLEKSTPKLFAKILQNLSIFREFVPENPAKLDFFLCDLSEALISALWAIRQGAV